MDDDDFGADADFLAALAATDVAGGSSSAPRPQPPWQQQPPQRPTPQQQQLRSQPPTAPRIQQPIPQRMERPGGGGAPPPGAGQKPRIVQPTPQALPGGIGSGVGGASGGAPRAAIPATGSTILVSPRQKGNPILAQLRSVPWEYSDIVADYGLGATSCALFLSLKYHRLHPEYIFARFRGLQGKYRLRVLLALVDIENHEEPLRELAKTSLVNQVTLVLCWSAAEAARYLELYKAFEHATGFAAIRGQQAAGYAERLVQFATVPRAVNKADAVALVGAFGSLRRAVLAEPEQLGLVSGWGEKKVQAWRRAVEAPFRVQKGARRRKVAGAGAPSTAASSTVAASTPVAPSTAAATQDDMDDVDDDGDAVFNSRLDQVTAAPPQKGAPDTTAAGSAGSTGAAAQARGDPPTPTKRGTAAASTFQSPPSRRRPPAEELSGGVAAALAKLREKE